MDIRNSASWRRYHNCRSHDRITQHVHCGSEHCHHFVASDQINNIRAIKIVCITNRLRMTIVFCEFVKTSPRVMDQNVWSATGANTSNIPSHWSTGKRQDLGSVELNSNWSILPHAAALSTLPRRRYLRRTMSRARSKQNCQLPCVVSWEYSRSRVNCCFRWYELHQKRPQTGRLGETQRAQNANAAELINNGNRLRIRSATLTNYGRNPAKSAESPQVTFI